MPLDRCGMVQCAFKSMQSGAMFPKQRSPSEVLTCMRALIIVPPIQIWWPGGPLRCAGLVPWSRGPVWPLFLESTLRYHLEEVFPFFFCFSKRRQGSLAVMRLGARAPQGRPRPAGPRRRKERRGRRPHRAAASASPFMIGGHFAAFRIHWGALCSLLQRFWCSLSRG